MIGLNIIMFISRLRQVFRKGMGTTDDIFNLHRLISHCINTNDKIFAAFVDFQKAFDYIM